MPRAQVCKIYSSWTKRLQWLGASHTSFGDRGLIYASARFKLWLLGEISIVLLQATLGWWHYPWISVRLSRSINRTRERIFLTRFRKNRPAVRNSQSRLQFNFYGKVDDRERVLRVTIGFVNRLLSSLSLLRNAALYLSVTFVLRTVRRLAICRGDTFAIKLYEKKVKASCLARLGGLLILIHLGIHLTIYSRNVEFINFYLNHFFFCQ